MFTNMLFPLAVVHLSTNSHIFGMAVDSEMKMLFIADSGYSVIATMGYDGSNYSEILSRNDSINETISIVLDTEQSDEDKPRLYTQSHKQPCGLKLQKRERDEN